MRGTGVRTGRVLACLGTDSPRARPVHGLSRVLEAAPLPLKMSVITPGSPRELFMKEGFSVSVPSEASLTGIGPGRRS